MNNSANAGSSWITRVMSAFDIRAIAGSQKRDHGFLPLLGDDGLLDLAALNEENAIRRVALPVYDLILAIIGNGSSAVYFREKHFGIERQLSWAFHRRPSLARAYPHPRRSYAASREAPSDARSSVVAAPGSTLAAELTGEAFDQPAADPGIRTSRINTRGPASRTAIAPAHLPATGLHPRQQGYDLAGGPRH